VRAPEVDTSVGIGGEGESVLGRVPVFVRDGTGIDWRTRSRMSSPVRPEDDEGAKGVCVDAESATTSR
jgi:hypothetical protein